MAYFFAFTISLLAVGPAHWLTEALVTPMWAISPIAVFIHDYLWPFLLGAVAMAILVGIVFAVLRLIGLAFIPPRRR